MHSSRTRPVCRPRLEALEERTLLSYSFQPIAILPGPAPGGGGFINDFEPWSINNQGKLAFAADLTTGGEGIFVRSPGGPVTQIMRTGQPAPGGGTFGGGVLGDVALNNNGAGAFAYLLEPFTLPLGNNSGVYRFSGSTGVVTPVVRPGVTAVPGGGTFSGSYFNVSLNNRGDLAFTGMVPATIGPGASIGLGLGVFQANTSGHITTVARPGDPAPGGGTFDYVVHPWVNDSGAVAFEAHVASDECIAQGMELPVFIFCAGSVYKKTAAGAIQSIAHQGDPAPGGGTYRLAFAPAMNNAGDMVFIGDLTPAPGAGERLAVFLNSEGTTRPVARPGDLMPGGGHFVTAGFFSHASYSLNNRGDVTFCARLDTDVNGDGERDTGLYVRTGDDDDDGGSLQLVARTGTVIPGVGTVASVNPPSFAGSTGAALFGGGAINNRGQIFFQVTLTDGTTGVLLVATPDDDDAGPSGGGSTGDLAGPRSVDAASAAFLSGTRAITDSPLAANRVAARVELPPGSSQPLGLFPSREDGGRTPAPWQALSASAHAAHSGVRERIFGRLADGLRNELVLDDLALSRLG